MMIVVMTVDGHDHDDSDNNHNDNNNNNDINDHEDDCRLKRNTSMLKY